MRMCRIIVLLGALSLAAAPPDNKASGPIDDFFSRMQIAIENHLGRPYVWGASGLKSFDCSGFVWRVLFESGVLIKRTTARKLYYCLPHPPPDQKWSFGNIVFFDNLKHCGIVADAKQFFHAESSVGTNLSQLTPFWRQKVYGVRAAPKPVQ